jgi:hypothetical protein
VSYGGFKISLRLDLTGPVNQLEKKPVLFLWFRAARKASKSCTKAAKRVKILPLNGQIKTAKSHLCRPIAAKRRVRLELLILFSLYRPVFTAAKIWAHRNRPTISIVSAACLTLAYL